MCGRRWESSAENCEGQNGDAKRELHSPSYKGDYPVQASENDDDWDGLVSNHKDSHGQGIVENFTETRSTVSSVEECTPKNMDEKTLDHSKSWRNDLSRLSYYYLFKVDISAEKLCIPSCTASASTYWIFNRVHL